MKRPLAHQLALLSLGVIGTTIAEVPDVSARQMPVKLPSFTGPPQAETRRDLATEHHIRQQHQARRK